MGKRVGIKLSVRLVENLGPGKYSDNGGYGLLLWVKPSGKRYWVQRVTVHGKRRDIGLGANPLVSLRSAREVALANARSIHDGHDPIRAKREAQRAAAQRLSFAVAAQCACSELAPTWRGKKEAASFMSSLQRHVFPSFGSTLVDEVTAAQVRRVILKCREGTPNLSTKVQHRILAVFKYAVAEGLRPDNPASAEALALPRHDRRTKHNRSLPYGELADALAIVDDSRAWVSTKLAVAFAAHTAGRSGEVRGATWAEIDKDAAVWVIPAERMKSAREHRVPLSAKTLEILEHAQQLGDGTGLVFPSATGRELSDNTLTKLLRDLSIPSTIHGFRASFRTWCQEQSKASYETAEAALAHVTGDATVAAYARSDLFEKRRSLMAEWSYYLT